MRRLLLAWVVVASSAHAYAPSLERTVLVLLRTLAYDRALPARAPEGIRIGIVHADDATSRQQAVDVAAVLGGLQGTTIAGRQLAEPVLLPASGAAPDLSAAVGALVLCEGLPEDVLRAVSGVARARDLGTLALDPAYVGRGATLGVEQRGARLEVLLDRTAASEEGGDFSSELLDLARIVEPR